MSDKEKGELCDKTISKQLGLATLLANALSNENLVNENEFLMDFIKTGTQIKDEFIKAIDKIC